MISMYRENIMDHYRNPRNKGELDKYDVNFHDTNPSCGDEVDWFVKIDNGRIENVGVKSTGCAISQAATSMLSDYVKGKEVTEVIDMDNDEIFELLGVEVSAMRIKCALLGLKALQKALIGGLDED